MAPPKEESPADVIFWLEEFVRALDAHASEELLSQHMDKLDTNQLQLRLMFLAQMVASNTTTEQRKGWSVKLITDMARHFGVDL